MSMLKLKTASDLEGFLRVLAEESVKASHQKLKEDSEQKDYEAALSRDKKLYKQGLHEQEDEGAEEEVVEEEPVEEEPVEEEPAEEEAVEEEPAEEEPAEEEAGEDALPGANYVTIRDEINNIRSGHSLKLPTTRQNLETYVDRLDPDEKTVLLTYLKALSNIMHGKIAGDEAEDPSDVLGFELGGGKPSEEGEGEEEGGEDTSPPIKVGKEEQVSEIFRKRITSLMKG